MGYIWEEPAIWLFLNMLCRYQKQQLQKTFCILYQANELNTQIYIFPKDEIGENISPK